MTTNVIDLEAKGCFDFFWNEANTDKTSPGYGLIRDNTRPGGRQMASIASVGFGLSAYLIGIERNWITYDEGYERTKGTLLTFLNEVEQVEGFFYHFLNMETAKKYEEFYDCPSIIDTSIFLNGALTSAEYFGGDIAGLFEEIYARVNWKMYYDEKNNWFYMGYKEGSGGFGKWDMYAEQMMQYILGAASPTHPVPAKIYKGFKRVLGTYGDYELYNSPAGQLFTHQFSHAWFNFNGIVDEDGIDWFDNSIKATLANRQYCIDHGDQFLTFHKDSWGLTACSGPNGYCGPGAPPYYPDVLPSNDGTVAPAGAAGSIVFTPQESIEALDYYYHHQPELWGGYGFQDAYNLDVEPAWFSDHVIGIDKGITLLMIENYKTGFVWDLYMKNSYVKKAAELLNWTPVDDQPES
ncbi:glucoamylase family protein [Rossellomorea marisflavi]|uniref:glucoamylase family protein n=1 Tax=Rossellomorea marisflavi TaxID=189381 RepID=UPI00351494FE